MMLLQLKTKERITAALDIMAVDPFSNTLDIKPMVGRPEEFRLRVGDYRLIYTVENDVLVVYVLKVYPRGDVYKNSRATGYFFQVVLRCCTIVVVQQHV